MSWIQTLEGNQFLPMAPDPEAISIETIARVLSRIPRFGGHTLIDYSVAEHSIHVCELVEEPELKLPALLHDAHEAYSGFGDVCSPVRCYAPMLEHMERRIDQAVARRFGFNFQLLRHQSIKAADLRMLVTEKRDLMAPEPASWGELPEPLPDPLVTMTNARERFLYLFNQLTS